MFVGKHGPGSPANHLGLSERGELLLNRLLRIARFLQERQTVSVSGIRLSKVQGTDLLSCGTSLGLGILNNDFHFIPG